MATLRRPLRICSVRRNGRRHARWSYDRRARVLRVSFRGKRVRLVARSC
jgi:hypothetical protein